MAAGVAPPKHVFAHGYLLVGGEKMSKTRAQPDRARRSRRASSASTASATTSSRDQRFGPDGDFSYEAMVARYNADLANNFGNLANRVLNMAVNYCGGVVPDARDDGPLVDAAATAFDALTDGMDELDYSSGFGAVWELIRATNSYIEDQQPWALNKAGDAAAVAAVLGDCLEALRVVALLASPLIPRAPAELWRRLGLAGTPEDAAAPRGRGVGRPARGRPAGEGRPALPAIETDRPADVTLGRQPLPPAGARPGRTRDPDGDAVAEARAAGVDGAGLRGHRPRDAPAGRSSSPRRHPDVRATVGPPPPRRLAPRRRVGRRSWPWPATRRRGGRHRRGRASTSTTTTRRATSRRPRSARRSQLAHRARPRARDPLARRVGRHLPRARRRRRARSARCSTASPADPTKRAARSTSARTSRSAASCRSRTPTTCAPRPRSRRSTACWSRPTRRSSRRCRTAGSAERAGVGRRRRRRARRGHGPATSTRSRPRRAANAEVVFGPPRPRPAADLRRPSPGRSRRAVTVRRSCSQAGAPRYSNDRRDTDPRGGSDRRAPTTCGPHADATRHRARTLATRALPAHVAQRDRASRRPRGAARRAAWLPVPDPHDLPPIEDLLEPRPRSSGDVITDAEPPSMPRRGIAAVQADVAPRRAR